MKRTKRHTLRRIALGIAVAAVLAPAAQAKPSAVKQEQPPVEITAVKLGSGEIPYVSHRTLRVGPGEVPYLDDDSTTATVTHEPIATIDDGADVTYGIVSGAVIALLVTTGLAFFAVRQTRKTRLAPA